VRSDGTNDERSPNPRVGCAPAGKALAQLGRFQREGLLERERCAAARWHRTARGAGSGEPDRTAGSHPPRSSGCRARHHFRLIAPGYATCRRLRFGVINPRVRRSFWRLQQPIRRLLLLAHPSDLELAGVDLLPHQGEANSLPLRVAPGRTDEYVDVGHAPPSLPSDPDWCYKTPGLGHKPAAALGSRCGPRQDRTPGRPCWSSSSKSPCGAQPRKSTWWPMTSLAQSPERRSEQTNGTRPAATP
jgi:hypothetical protein